MSLECVARAYYIYASTAVHDAGARRRYSKARAAAAAVVARTSACRPTPAD
eukprot:COSAG02_NODE_538_length_20609_cov_7.009703_14_plen_51_part_00